MAERQVIDVSSARSAQEIVESEARLRFAVEASSIGIWTWEIATEAVYWSAQCFEIMGVSSFRGTRADFAEAVLPEDAPALWALVNDAIAHQHQFHAEFRIRRPDGSIRWLANFGRAEYDSGGRAVRMLGTVQDITARKQAELDLARAYAERDAVVFAVAHELRNFVSGIDMSVAILRHERLDSARREDARKTAQQRSASLVRFVSDLFDVSKVNMGQMSIDLQTIELHDVIQQALELVRSEMVRRSQVLHVDLSDEQLVLRGDRLRLCQVLVNVLLNASKYTPDGGSIRLIVRSDGTDARLEVIDTGRGIESGKIGTVFDLYSQVDGRNPGLGIGLYLARHLVEHHGGTISAASKGLNQGSTFTITLPLSGSDPAAAVS